MGRPRGFDENAVLTRSAAVFRERGYDGTSIDALVEATGLHRGSLYSTFGSKRGLFLAVLDRIAPGRSGTAELDLLLVALLDLAPHDTGVRRVVRDLVTGLGPAATDTLGRRLLRRASIAAPALEDR